MQETVVSCLPWWACLSSFVGVCPLMLRVTLILTVGPGVQVIPVMQSPATWDLIGWSVHWVDRLVSGLLESPEGVIIWICNEDAWLFLQC